MSVPDELSDEKSKHCLKIRLSETENSSVRDPPQQGTAKLRLMTWRPSSERPSVPHSDQHRLTSTVDPRRLELIQQRMRSNFYDEPPASERIAASVLAELNDLKEGPPALPR